MFQIFLFIITFIGGFIIGCYMLTKLFFWACKYHVIQILSAPSRCRGYIINDKAINDCFAKESSTCNDGRCTFHCDQICECNIEYEPDDPDEDEIDPEDIKENIKEIKPFLRRVG